MLNKTFFYFYQLLFLKFFFFLFLIDNVWVENMFIKAIQAGVIEKTVTEVLKRNAKRVWKPKFLHLPEGLKGKKYLT